MTRSRRLHAKRHLGIGDPRIVALDHDVVEDLAAGVAEPPFTAVQVAQHPAVTGVATGLLDLRAARHILTVSASPDGEMVLSRRRGPWPARTCGGPGASAGGASARRVDPPRRLGH